MSSRYSYDPIKFGELDAGIAPNLGDRPQPPDPVELIKDLINEINERFETLSAGKTGRPIDATQPALTFVSTNLTAVVNLGSGVWFDSTAPKAASIPGFTGGYGGRVVVFHNGSDFTYTIIHECTSVLEQYRVKSRTATSITVTTGNALVMVYDDAQQRWIPVSTQV